MDATETGIYYSIIICGSLLIFFVLLFIGSSIWLQRKFKKSQEQRLKAEVNAMERERARIATDLHDDVNGTVYGIIKGLDHPQAESAMPPDITRECKINLKALDKKIKTVIHNMAPINLRESGVQYCLEELSANTSTMSDLEIEFGSDSLPKMDINDETHIYRIMQEIVLNTLKHSNASILSVIIRVDKTGRKIRIQSADNGKGIASERMETNTGLGVDNIKSRALFLNGTAVMNGRKGVQWVIDLAPAITATTAL